jgi:hypothetical protein
MMVFKKWVSANMGKNVMNERELSLIYEAIDIHLSILIDMHENNPEQEDRMRQYKALLTKIAPVK